MRRRRYRQHVLRNIESIEAAGFVDLREPVPEKIGIEGEESGGVISAMEMLRAIGTELPPDLSGQRVVVIGGGNVAMDVTRSAMRLGAASVTCVYRRRLEDMTALPEEVEGAIAEGCEVLTAARA